MEDSSSAAGAYPGRLAGAGRCAGAERDCYAILVDARLDQQEAVLLDHRTGDKVGTHGKGPFWVDGEGGKVEAKLVASLLAPAPVLEFAAFGRLSP